MVLLEPLAHIVLVSVVRDDSVEGLSGFPSWTCHLITILIKMEHADRFKTAFTTGDHSASSKYCQWVT